MSEKIVLLLNLGSPDSPNIEDVRRYLNQFLMDPDVIDLPWLTRKLLVRLLILPFRAPKSAHAYASIWTDEGSPLLLNNYELKKQIQAHVKTPIYMAMRYGTPSIEQTLFDIKEQHPKAKEIITLPLYPHYACSTIKSGNTEITRIVSQCNMPFKITTLPPFYNHPDYIQALIESAKPWLIQPHDHILFSYHGVPERHITKDDPTNAHCLKPGCCETPSPAHATCYRYQVLQTTRTFAAQAGLSTEQYTIAFQSRLGKAKWLQPYTKATLIKLAQTGVKRLLVLCPSFTADCLETLEEIGIQGRSTFKEAGGKELTLIPCLNSHPQWVATLSEWITQEIAS